jgi:hypothetical protein
MKKEPENMAKSSVPHSKLQNASKPSAKRKEAVRFNGKNVSKEELKAMVEKLPADQRGVTKGKRLPASRKGIKNKVAAEDKPKGKPRGASRLGKPNTITKQLKEMILGALDDRGGQQYLATQAILNPAPFMALLGKILPTQVTGDAENPLQVQLVSTAEALLAKIRGGGAA